MGKQHLDPLATMTRPLEGRRAGQSTGDLSGMLIDRAGSGAGRVGTAPLLEVTGPTIECAAR